MKRLLAVCTTALLAGALAVGGVTAASAEGESVDPATITTSAVEEAPATEAPVEAVVVEAPPAPAEEPAVEQTEETPAIEAKPSNEPMVLNALSPPVPMAQMVETFVAKSSDNGYDPKLNDPKTWENTEHESTCYKHEANNAGWSSNAHGQSLGDEVWLNEFDEDAWKGDHWERLVIKAGTTNTVIEHPVAGTHYSTEDGKNVSHWIVCKGETPVVVDPCPAPDFLKEKMWEVTWGYGFEDRNGGLAKFNMQSNGGLVAYNDGPVPTYMTADWHWLYPVKGQADKTYKYTFADGTVRTATVTGADCTPTIVWTETPPVTNANCVDLANGGTATELNANGWASYDTRSAGHAEYVDGGLHVWTDDASSQAKVSWARSLNIPLKDVGQLSVNYTNNSTATFPHGPGLNLFVDITGDGKSDGTLVYEEVYGQDLWVTNGSSQALKDASLHTGGNGSANHGTIDHYLKTFPNAVVVGGAFALGSGVLADGVIHSITIGCANYYFDSVPKTIVTPPKPEWVDPCGEANGYWDFPEVEGVSYSQVTNKNGSVTATATVSGWFEFPVDAKTSWTKKDSGELCPVVITETPKVEFVDECGTENDKAVYEDTEEYTFSEETVDGQVVVTATASEGFEFAEGVQTTWTSEFTDEDCPVTVVEKPKVASLPFTGFDETLLLIGAWLLGLGALGFGGAKLIRGRN